MARLANKAILRFPGRPGTPVRHNSRPAGQTAIVAAALLAATTAIAPSPAVATFTQLVQFGSSTTLTIAVSDYDRDGDQDVAVGNNPERDELYRNDGGGVFTRLLPFGTGTPTLALAWGDFDNDGDPDLAAGRNSDFQGNRLYVNNGDGTFTAQNQFGASRTIAMAWADYDRDGDLDLAEGNGILGTDRQNMLYVNNGDGTFTGQSEFGTSQTDAVAWGDFDNDGDPDLAVANGGFTGVPQQNYLYVNNGDGTFNERAEFGSGDTASLGWGDYDNDGDLDLAIGNWQAGRCYLYVNSGNGTFSEVPDFGDRDTNALNWGDADDDGFLDLATANGNFTAADSNMLYLGSAAGTFTERAEFGLGSTDAISWVDYDNDGDLDVAAGNEHSPSQNYLYRNNENDSRYLSVRLVGAYHDLGAGYSNRDAIGARVYAYRAGHLGESGHLLGMREIEAHGGFASQSAIDAHFGFPGVTSVDLRIVWPGSAGRRLVQDLPGTAVPQRLTVPETGAFTEVATLPSIESRGDRERGVVVSVTPNPAHGAMQFTLREGAGSASDTRGAARLRIWDTEGRLVRSLTVPAAAGGDHSRVVDWDGRGTAGEEVPAGVYFARADHGAPAATRVVILR